MSTPKGILTVNSCNSAKLSHEELVCNLEYGIYNGNLIHRKGRKEHRENR